MWVAEESAVVPIASTRASSGTRLGRLIAGVLACLGVIGSLDQEAHAAQPAQSGSGATSAAETLTFARAIELGLKRSPQLAAARARSESADARTTQARAGYFPTLNASLSGGGATVRDTQPAPPPSDQVFVYVTNSFSATAAVSLRWTLWDFGRTSNAATAADAAFRAAQASASAVEASVIGDVTTAYVNVVYRTKLGEIAATTVATREKLSLLSKALVKSGLQPAVEELRAGGRLEAARRDLAGVEAEAADGRVGLAVLLGLDPAQPLRVVAPKLPTAEADLERAVHEAEEKNPIVANAEATAEARRAEAETASSRYFPTVGLQGDASYRFAHYDRNDALISARTASAQVVLSAPVFDIGIPSGLSAARAEARQAEANGQSAKLEARREAARAAVALRASLSVMQHAKKAAEASATVYAVIQARYTQGLSPPLELYDAETTDIQARSERVRAELSQTLATVRLLVATGQTRRLKEEVSRD
jgi:outer membrane protein